MKVGFVVLCYMNYKVVIDCVDSLMKLREIEKNEVVIVDNNSNNEAVNELEKKYNSNPIVSILKNSINEGYARGNNLGYKYLKEKKCDFIVIINSDAYIQNMDFINILYYKYKKTDFGIIAPDIVNRDGSHVNPGSSSNYKKLFFIKSIIKNCICIILTNVGFDYRQYSNKKRNIKDNRKINSEINYFIPHGSCIIFTNKWIENEEKAFCDNTFLFFEERFLVAYCEKKRYLIEFDDSLKVLHDEDGSIQELNPTEKKKTLFVLKNQNKSLIKFLRFIDDPIKNW